MGWGADLRRHLFPLGRRHGGIGNRRSMTWPGDVPHIHLSHAGLTGSLKNTPGQHGSYDRPPPSTRAYVHTSASPGTCPSPRTSVYNPARSRVQARRVHTATF